MTTYDRWLDAYSVAYDTVHEPFEIPCPHCGSTRLRLVFTGNPESDVGYAHFWCDHCLYGIGVSRTVIPDGAVVQDIRQVSAERQPSIPNYRLIR
ncbi:hypothetical protein Aca07nite_80240 [Actinoplanes capillaceus]|uniref:Uncharacterized protein n=2 Tax=Actinoplanes campanulatus TaxID=113559 RepID=A0ABQ3WWU1_9ACTN|nr:hypothetical protein [Actinoplanes capillaceus]GID50749.1 hypothetical protein Aca07nite_80240 [Actinoplanes capillaceus]